MKLIDILDRKYVISKTSNTDNLEIGALYINSKEKEDNGLYFCINGEKLDGHIFAAEAVSNGAKAIVVERLLDIKIPQILVENCREAMAIFAKRFYDNSADKLTIIGVSGTNGKTTTTYLISHILKDAGFNVGLIGTEGIYINNQFIEQKLTTPDPIDLHKYFYMMVKQNVKYVIMEVSAHSIYFEKIIGINFDIGVLTNITQDHLDFFKNFETYKDTKLSFLSSRHVKLAVVNCDDEILKEAFEKINIPKISYAINNPADVFAIDISMNISGSSFVANVLDDVFFANIKIAGMYNVNNCLAASTVCKLLGLSPEKITSALSSFDGVPGRFI